MPRLLSWEQKLASEATTLKVAFVSIDDDARQLETFLAAQPPTGVQKAYWLRDGQERLAWLKEAGMESEPELPAHLLVDPSGRVRCKQQGAIEDADYGEVAREQAGAGQVVEGGDEHAAGEISGGAEDDNDAWVALLADARQRDCRLFR